ncbi:MAG: hypothetical protein WC249_03640 [Patescibacteria group bacterium]|jgi:hypothetical protein
MKSFEHYKKQINRVTESALGGEAVKDVDVREYLSTFFRRGESKLDRAIAFLSLVRSLAPCDLRYNYRTEHLPISPESYEFKGGTIGRGGENDVYLLEARKENLSSWVLKINHVDKGDTTQLVARAKEIKNDYEQIKNWFQDMPGLIPEECTVIMEDPRDRQPAIITLQQYYGREIRDVFKDIDLENREKIFQDSPEFKEEIQKFLKINEDKLQETGNMIDLIGAKNLSFVKVDDQDKLLVLDPHLISNPFRSEDSTKKKQRERLDYLHTLVDGVAVKEKEIFV